MSWIASCTPWGCTARALCPVLGVRLQCAAIMGARSDRVAARAPVTILRHWCPARRGWRWSRCWRPPFSRSTPRWSPGCHRASAVVLAVSGALVSHIAMRPDDAAFIMEMPLYHPPNARTIGLLHMGAHRGLSKRPPPSSSSCRRWCGCWRRCPMALSSSYPGGRAAPLARRRWWASTEALGCWRALCRKELGGHPGRAVRCGRGGRARSPVRSRRT